MKGLIINLNQDQSAAAALTQAFAKLSHKLEVIADTQTFARKSKLANFCIVLATTPTPAVGYYVAKAASENMPVMLISPIDKKELTVFSPADRKLVFAYPVAAGAKLDQQVADFLQNIADIIDSKFIFILSPASDKYLQWAAAERRMHKSQLVREAIEATMKADKRFKLFMAGVID